jgi:quercetin dioxygenase-like cupin family protein
MSRRKFVTVAWAVVSVAGVTAAVATDQSGDISRNELAVGKVAEPIEIDLTQASDVRFNQITFAPGSNSGWHTHPGPETAVVKAGEIILQRSPACDPITVAAGQGVFIPGDMPHLVHNDTKEPAEIYTTQMVPAGTTVLRLDADEQCVGKDAPEEPAPEEKDAPPADEK